MGSIRNESKKFKISVANRIELIGEQSEAEQWQYVNTKENPADYVSRVWVTETKLNHGFLGQNFFGNHKIPGTLTPILYQSGRSRAKKRLCM